MALKFYRCAHCGQIIAFAKNVGVPVKCCGENMQEIIPGTTDAAAEKHVPVWTAADGIVSVKVGEVDHPMQEAHYIEWIAIETSAGSQIKYLKPGDAPKAEFAILPGEEVAGVYAYCNLHSLWKS